MSEDVDSRNMCTAVRTVYGHDGRSYTLQPPVKEDIEDFYRLHADPRVWQHYPSGRHTTIERSEEDLDKFTSEWRTGVSYWSLKDPDSKLVGVGGIRSLLDDTVWNIYYRISPEHAGQGLATKVAFEAIDLAKLVNPNRPIVAYMLKNNPSSTRVAEKVGLKRRWAGSDAGNPDPLAIRYIYSDHELDQSLLDRLTAY